MIELNTLSDGVARLYNPDHIIETGSYSRSLLNADRVGSAREPSEGGAADERVSYIVTTGGFDPVDVVQTPTDVAYLIACWKARSRLTDYPIPYLVRLLAHDPDHRNYEFEVAGEG